MFKNVVRLEWTRKTLYLGWVEEVCPPVNPVNPVKPSAAPALLEPVQCKERKKQKNCPVATDTRMRMAIASHDAQLRDLVHRYRIRPVQAYLGNLAALALSLGRYSVL